jgi:predicted alpha/beta-fold hydrolase
MTGSNGWFRFAPLPLLSNPHVQTLLGHFLPAPGVPYTTRPWTIVLPDGDGLVLHDTTPPTWREGEAIAVLAHGLTGSHASRPIRRLACLLVARGTRVVRLDLRGAGAGLPLARRGYHAGCSEDVRCALEAIHHQAPISPLWLVGVSLGGNAVLKLAGEASDRPVPHLRRVGALNPPIDIERCSQLISQAKNRLYEKFFVRGLVSDVQARQRLFADLPALAFPPRLSLRDFDDLYTAPAWGFASALDYYRQASALSYIPRIRVPTLILTARDDPFIAPEPFEEVKPAEVVTIRMVPHGGHLGYLSWEGIARARWAEYRMVDWLTGGLAGCSSGQALTRQAPGTSGR